MKTQTGFLKGTFFLVLGLLFAQTGSSAELATILGRPNTALDFAQNLIKESESISSEPFEAQASTQMYSILARNGIEATANLEAIAAEGTMQLDTLHTAFLKAATKAPVVFTIIGPLLDEACQWLEAMKDVVYVFPAGKSGSLITPEEAPHCMAPNILRVAALNGTGTQASLASFSNFGLAVKLAAPGTKLPVIGANGKRSLMSSTSAAAAIVAAHLGVYARNHPELRGGVLVEKFLTERSAHSNLLDGKIEGGRALIEGSI